MSTYVRAHVQASSSGLSGFSGTVFRFYSEQCANPVRDFVKTPVTINECNDIILRQPGLPRQLRGDNTGISQFTDNPNGYRTDSAEVPVVFFEFPGLKFLMQIVPQAAHAPSVPVLRDRLSKEDPAGTAASH